MTKYINIAILSTLLAFITSSNIIIANENDKQLEFEGTKLNISAKASTEIEEDLLIANLRYESEGESAKIVQDTINKKMQQALAFTKNYKSVKTRTNNYNVHKKYVRPTKNINKKQIWKGQQSLTIKGIEKKDVLTLVGKLQEMGFASNGLNFTVSPEKYERAKESLLEEAINNLKKKAQRIANSLGKKEFQIKRLNINSGGRGYHRNNYAEGAKMMMSSDAISAPVAANGERQVMLSVSATILIK